MTSEEKKPTEVEVLEYLRPMISEGKTMPELRQILKKAKKRWSYNTLYKVVKDAVEARNKERTISAIMRIMTEQGHIDCGGIVLGVMKYPVNKEGKVEKGWETAILCSNPKGPAKRPSEGPDKGPSKVLPGSSKGPSEVVPDSSKVLPGSSKGPSEVVPDSSKVLPGSTQQGDAVVPDIGMILPQPDGSDMDYACKSHL